MHELQPVSTSFSFFFFNDTATTEIYALSLHDALPISSGRPVLADGPDFLPQPLHLLGGRAAGQGGAGLDRKSTRLNSSHANISYAVFCLKKKNNTQQYLVCRLGLQKKNNVCCSDFRTQ